LYGDIHVKSIPGADPLLIDKLGRLADRISINIELPSQNSLATLAPEKNKDLILKPMGYIAGQIRGNGYKSIENSKFKSLPQKVSKSSTSLIAYKNGKSGVFAPAGQSTQMIIGASPETDLHILRLSENLYKKYELKRVFFSAYIPISDNPLLPSVDTKPPLLREHRLYQADFLMRFYKFQADEILNERNPNFNPFVDPKCNWALNHPEFFPIDINTASYEELLRAPGIGVLSAKKIIAARRFHSLDFSDLKKFSVVLKRAKYFIVCSGKKADGVKTDKASIMQSLMSKNEMNRYKGYFPMPQLELFQQNTSLPPLSL
jgi:putative DNA modification/repair radical SAM protein